MAGRWKSKQDKLYLIARALHISPAWLTGYDVPMEWDSPVRVKTTEEPPIKEQEIDIDGEIEKAYGYETRRAVGLFTRLDSIDKGCAIGNMETILQEDKYKREK